MQLIRLVKVHYLVPQLARQDLLKCRRLMVHSLKVQTAVLDRRDQVQIQALGLTFLQVHSDEASLILRPHRLVAHRDLQQIMLMEVLRQHHRYSVASLQHHLLVDRRDQVGNKDQQVDNKDQQVDHSRDQVHLMVQLL